MKLQISSLADQTAWAKMGFALPEYDIKAMCAQTLDAPEWIHFGAGNIFRAFPAAAQQRMLNSGAANTGIIACEGYDGDIIDKAYTPFDNLSVLAVLKSDGSVEKRVIGSVAAALRLDRAEDEQVLRAQFIKPSLQMVSFTITEKGYAVRGADGALFGFIGADVEAGPNGARSTIGKLCALLHNRFECGAYPLALVSMDNCSHNGDKLREAVLTIAEGWLQKGRVSAEFIAYLSDSSHISFPWTMIDKITPRPDAKVAEMLDACGFEDTQTIVTEKNTYTAAFVNAEETEYLVIEDCFPNGRPALEKAGLYFADRDTVNRVEKMKVCTCLNPLHTALAVLGCLLDFPTIYSEMQDEYLSELVRRIAYREGMPVVVDPGILSPKKFADEVIELRLSNPFMPDTPQRIATDTSQKLSIRYGETIKAYRNNSALNLKDLHCIPFVFAAWLRYLMGVDDALQPFEPSPDPLLNELKAALGGLRIGGSAEVAAPLLRRADIFGVDLTEIGLDGAVLSWLEKMITGKGAVRAALQELIG